MVASVGFRDNNYYLTNNPNAIRQDTKTEVIQNKVQELLKDGEFTATDAEKLFNEIATDGIISKDETDIINKELKKANLELTCSFDDSKFNFDVRLTADANYKGDIEKTGYKEIKFRPVTTLEKKEEKIEIKADDYILNESNKKIMDLATKAGFKDVNELMQAIESGKPPEKLAKYDEEFNKLPDADKFFALNNGVGITKREDSHNRWANGFKMDATGNITYEVSKMPPVKLTKAEQAFVADFNAKTPEQRRQIYMQVVQADFNFNASIIKNPGTFIERMKANEKVYEKAIQKLMDQIPDKNLTPEVKKKMAETAYGEIATKVFKFMTEGPNNDDLTIGKVQTYLATLAPEIGETSKSNNKETDQTVTIRDANGQALVTLKVLDGIDGTATQRQKRHIGETVKIEPPVTTEEKIQVSFSAQDNPFIPNYPCRMMVACDTSGSMGQVIASTLDYMRGVTAGSKVKMGFMAYASNNKVAVRASSDSYSKLETKYYVTEELLKNYKNSSDKRWDKIGTELTSLTGKTFKNVEDFQKTLANMNIDPKYFDSIVKAFTLEQALNQTLNNKEFTSQEDMRQNLGKMGLPEKDIDLLVEESYQPGTKIYGKADGTTPNAWENFAATSGYERESPFNAAITAINRGFPATGDPKIDKLPKEVLILADEPDQSFKDYGAAKLQELIDVASLQNVNVKFVNPGTGKEITLDEIKKQICKPGTNEIDPSKFDSHIVTHDKNENKVKAFQWNNFTHYPQGVKLSDKTDFSQLPDKIDIQGDKRSYNFTKKDLLEKLKGLNIYNKEYKSIDELKEALLKFSIRDSNSKSLYGDTKAQEAFAEMILKYVKPLDWG